MRILFTNTGPWGTGSATVLDGVMKELVRRRHQVCAIFPDSGFRSVDLETYYGDPEKYRIVKFPVTYGGEYLYTFPLIITDPHPRNYHRAWTFKDLTENQLEAYMDYFRDVARKTISDFKPDIIECQHIWIMDYVIKQMGYEFISAAHHSDQMGFRFDKRMRDYATQSAIHASHIIAISKSTKKEVLDLYPVRSEKVSVIPNGYDESIFRPNRQNRLELLSQHGLLEYKDHPIITFTGKISRTKGADYLLMANKIIQKEREVLVLIFGAGKFEDVVDDELTDLYDFTNVVVMGHQTHQILSSFHNLARLSVLPSRSEGFGIAALEAMGCGTPVVASRTGGLTEFIVGSLVKTGDYFEFASQILKILDMPETDYEQLRFESHERAKDFSWRENVDRRLRIYEPLT